MCATCGCDSETKATVVNLQTGTSTVMMRGQEHSHGGAHTHTHEDGTHTHVHADGTRHTHHDHGHEHHHAHEGSHTHDHDHSHGHDHDHSHSHDDHGHSHSHDHSHSHNSAAVGGLIDLEKRILAKNEALAAKNRAWLSGREILALNLVSSPGAGKTSLLERTIRDLKGELDIFVIEGDQATSADGERISQAGAPAVQVNTGTGCHLEADMVARGIAELRPSVGSLLMIENVGNLVCPALFDLGERAKVVILSVTEGEDKPLKYPHMFRAAEIMILNKIDLLPHVDFDVDRCLAYAREVNPAIKPILVSARSGEGLDGWYTWLRQERAALQAATFAAG